MSDKTFRDYSHLCFETYSKNVPSSITKVRGRVSDCIPGSLFLIAIELIIPSTVPRLIDTSPRTRLLLGRYVTRTLFFRSIPGPLDLLLEHQWMQFHRMLF